MRRLLLASLAAAALSACGGDRPTATTALFSLAAGTGSGSGLAGVATDEDFYALPFPNDMRRTADGKLDLALFPTNSLIVDSYRVAAQDLDGFGLNAAMFARFSGPLDDTTLPDPAASVTAGANVYVVNIDPVSPDYNTRTPITATFIAKKGQTIGANRLAVRPFPGFPLDDGTTYALVITTRVHDAEGAPVVPSADFITALGGTGPTQAAYAPLLAWLAADADDKVGDIAAAAVFTTQHATFVAPALRKGVFAAAAPVATDVVITTPSPVFHVYTGAYQAPNFQSGDVPYMSSGGEIAIGSDGAAVVQRTETMRFALTVPTTPVPATGFPFAIYAHGTGGDYESFIDDGTAVRLAQQGIAVISTDQVLHGPRNPGGTPDIDFFNFANPYAARDNALQGAADAFAQLRLATGISIVDGTRTLTLDPARAMFFGHSQGGLTGPPFVAFEPSLKGAVLSGTGGILYLAMLYKKAPLDIPALVGTFLRDDPIDEDNASLALLQMWVERSDAANYAPLMVRKPVAGIAPRNIFQSEGFVDTFAPNPAIEAFATALGGDLVMTADAQPVPGLVLRASKTSPPPVSNNRNGVTAVLAQYKMLPGSDGHFVVFEVPAAKTQSAQFLGTLAATGTATVVVP